MEGIQLSVDLSWLGSLPLRAVPVFAPPLCWERAAIECCPAAPPALSPFWGDLLAY